MMMIIKNVEGNFGFCLSVSLINSIGKRVDCRGLYLGLVSVS